MIELTDIAYVRSGVADLGKAVTFATEIVGLELAGRTDDGTAYLRADGRHHCLALVEGRSGVIASGFTVADEDALAAAETELEHAGFTVARGDAAAARARRVRAAAASPRATVKPACSSWVSAAASASSSATVN